MKKNRFARSMLSLALLAATGCASMQPAPPPAAPAAPQFASSPPEVRVSAQFGALLVSIYHPETRTLYVWGGDPRADSTKPMLCYKIQLNDSASGAPQRQPCE